jgi:hypothetical protein
MYYSKCKSHSHKRQTAYQLHSRGTEHSSTRKSHSHEFKLSNTYQTHGRATDHFPHITLIPTSHNMTSGYELHKKLSKDSFICKTLSQNPQND